MRGAKSGFLRYRVETRHHPFNSRSTKNHSRSQNIASGIQSGSEGDQILGPGGLHLPNRRRLAWGPHTHRRDPHAPQYPDFPQQWRCFDQSEGGDGVVRMPGEWESHTGGSVVKKSLLPSGLQVQTGYLLSLTNVQREDAGAYQCTASNGIGQAVTGEIKLHVLFPPEITVAKSWVNSGEGLEARLDCVVHADPPGEVSWYQNSFPLQQTDRRIMSTKGKIYSLNIKNVQFSDFGNYSCTVHNSIGKDRKYIELTGKPGPARIISPAYSNPEYYDLRWVVQSVLPIIEVKILYRRINATSFYDHKGQWHDLVIKPEQKYDSKTSERFQSFRITNLVPDSLYECLILTKNQHGYSDVSDVHQWFSLDKGRPFVGSTGQIKSLGIAVIFLQTIILLL
ncbi:neogenin-like isoform X2 [Tribolium madens]|uniref:neogenin-like isoform X2 n=1 Tax=Tribolium madens TaxID=41895 RepID=UPI001CF742A9|nr:neogenin-like isoform X2 [Tribolium madens]